MVCVFVHGLCLKVDQILSRRCLGFAYGRQVEGTASTWELGSMFEEIMIPFDIVPRKFCALGGHDHERHRLRTSEGQPAKYKPVRRGIGIPRPDVVARHKA